MHEPIVGCWQEGTHSCSLVQAIHHNVYLCSAESLTDTRQEPSSHILGQANFCLMIGREVSSRLQAHLASSRSFLCQEKVIPWTPERGGTWRALLESFPFSLGIFTSHRECKFTRKSFPVPQVNEMHVHYLFAAPC